jgi:hypothetical protein
LTLSQGMLATAIKRRKPWAENEDQGGIYE